MDTPFLGMIILVGFNFAPRGWAFCDGQLLAISQNTALFALLGTTYGGNGQTTFQLPNLQGRVPVHPGQGAGLSPYVQGQVGGTETVTLTVQTMPAHSHNINASSGQGDTAAPANAFPANTGALDREYKSTVPTTDAVTMNPQMVGSTGGNQPFSILQPYLAMYYCIALEGIFPSRN